MPYPKQDPENCRTYAIRVPADTEQIARIQTAAIKSPFPSTSAWLRFHALEHLKIVPEIGHWQPPHYSISLRACVTESERESIRAAAKRCRMNISCWMLAVALAAAERAPKAPRKGPGRWDHLTVPAKAKARG